MTARLALAAGDGPRDPNPPIDEILRGLVEQTEANAAFVVDAYGQLQGAFEATTSAAGLDVSCANATAPAATDLLSGQVVWLENGKVVARVCGTVALLFVVTPKASPIRVGLQTTAAAEKIANAIVSAHPEAKPLT